MLKTHIFFYTHLISRFRLFSFVFAYPLQQSDLANAEAHEQRLDAIFVTYSAHAERLRGVAEEAERSFDSLRQSLKGAEEKRTVLRKHVEAITQAQQRAKLLLSELTVLQSSRDSMKNSSTALFQTLREKVIQFTNTASQSTYVDECIRKELYAVFCIH